MKNIQIFAIATMMAITGMAVSLTSCADKAKAVVETVGTVHHGENHGDEPAEVYVFYLSQEGMPLSVADE